jgi:hypothetical protein
MSGPSIFVFDELFEADQELRRHARTVDEAAYGLTVPAAGLPPEAQPIVAGVRALRGTLERAAEGLTSAAAAFGQAEADARRADAPGLLTYLKAGLAVLSAEGMEALLRHGGSVRLGRLRSDRTRHARALSRLHRRQAAALRAGDTALADRLQRDIRTRRSLYRKASRAIRATQRDLRDLRAAGRLKAPDERTLRLLKHLSGALGMRTASALLSGREWQRAIRDSGGVVKAPGHLARQRQDARRIPAAGRRLADSPALRKGLSVLPGLGIVADVADLADKAKRAWHQPNAGNIANAAAAGLHVAGNAPVVGPAADALGYTVEGGVLVGDHVDDAAHAVKGAAGAVAGAADDAKDFVKDKVDSVKDKVPFL